MDGGGPIEYDERLQAWKLWLHGEVWLLAWRAVMLAWRLEVCLEAGC